MPLFSILFRICILFCIFFLHCLQPEPINYAQSISASDFDWKFSCKFKMGWNTFWRKHLHSIYIFLRKQDWKVSQPHSCTERITILQNSSKNMSKKFVKNICQKIRQNFSIIGIQYLPQGSSRKHRAYIDGRQKKTRPLI